jgi:NADH dehydrogenase (ubiquinone) 1 alpha subcomplex subunit 4
MGGAVVGLAFWMGHLVQHPELVWSRKSNPFPYNAIQQDQTFKLYDFSGQFKKWVRSSL